MNRITNDVNNKFEIEKESTLALLAELGIEYRLYLHPPVSTMEDCESIGADVGAGHFKNLFLTNRAETEFFILLTPADKRFVTKDVSHALSVSRLCFASEAALMSKLGLVPGSVTPLGLMSENARDVTVVIDREILKLDKVCVHPRTPYASVAIKLSDVFTIIEHFGNPVRYI